MEKSWNCVFEFLREPCVTVTALYFLNFVLPSHKIPDQSAPSGDVLCVWSLFAHSIFSQYLLHDVASGSDIMLCIKIDKPATGLVVHIFTFNLVMLFIK